MFILGVTGPSGAGKGTACEILTNLGFYHIDTDKLVPEVYSKALPALVDAFGTQIQEKNRVNKKELARVAFASPEGMNTLNSILHPLIMDEVKCLISKAKDSGFSRVAVDGAALYEARAEEICDKIICITAGEDQRLSRVLKRDGISENAAKLRFKAQKDDAYYTSKSDAVIVNRTFEQLRVDLYNLIKEWEI